MSYVIAFRNIHRNNLEQRIMDFVDSTPNAEFLNHEQSSNVYWHYDFNSHITSIWRSYLPSFTPMIICDDLPEGFYRQEIQFVYSVNDDLSLLDDMRHNLRGIGHSIHNNIENLREAIEALNGADDLAHDFMEDRINALELEMRQVREEAMRPYNAILGQTSRNIFPSRP